MFLSVGERLINTKYIKEITKTKIVIANTEHCSVSVCGSYYNDRRELSRDQCITITPEQYQSILEQLSAVTS